MCVCSMCGCLGAWRCFGGKHKAHWPGLKTLLFQLTSPAACSTAGLIWRQRGREMDEDGGSMRQDTGKTEKLGREIKERLERVTGGETE